MPGVDLNYVMKQANELTKKIEKRKEALVNETLEAEAGEGRVKVVINGVQELRSIKIDKGAIDPADPSMLEDLVTAAVNSALVKSRDYMQTELAKVSGGIKIPGLT